MICRSLIKLVSVAMVLKMVLWMSATAAEEEKKDPEWAFCVAYTLRDPDEREARDAGLTNAEGEPEPWIPRSLVQYGVVDVAALASRTVAQKTLTKEAAQKVIKATFEGSSKLPAMDCYEPHHCFVFYTVVGEPVACIEVCLSCNHVKISQGKKLSGKERLGVDLVALARMLNEAGLPLTPYKSLQEYEKKAQQQIDSAEKL